MSIKKDVLCAGMLLSLCCFTAAQAADSYWINSAGGDFTNTSNWNPGGPGAADNAYFTNNASYQVDWTSSVTNSSALFNAPGGIVTQAIGSSFWLVTSSYIIGQSNGANVTVVQTSGTLLVTNASGTGQIVVGSVGNGNLDIEGGTVTTSNIVLGNVGGSSGHSLTIANGASLFTTTGTIGGTTSTDNNRALVNGPGSTWKNSGVITVGFRGVGNQLIITNQGFVSSGSTIVGDSSGSGQIVRVDGNGSIFTNTGNLIVGNIQGPGSSMWIANSGKVYNANGTVGLSGGNTSNNFVVVDGNGSAWINSGTAFIGDSASSNSLRIANGGLVRDTGGRIGNQAGANNNLVVVTDAGSVWTNSGTLVVGNNISSGANQLTVTNGGKVYSSGGTVGVGNNNAAVVNGSGSQWNDNGNLLVGGVGATGNRMSILNSGLVVSTSAMIGGGTGANSNTVTVAGNGSIWTNNGGLTNGFRGNGNQLIVTNGGLVYTTSAIVGSDGLAQNSTVTVTGNGSVWTNTGDLTVGLSGGGSQLLILNSGTVYSATGTIGVNAGASNGLTRVSGSGSSWNVVSNLMVGSDGANNQLVVENGGRVTSLTGKVGGGTGTNNSVLVTGTGSMWSNASSLLVGVVGTKNSMTISAGGKVFNTTASIGANSGVNNNTVVVTGQGSEWRNSSDLYVGNGGGTALFGNRLTIADGGLVVSSNAFIGYRTDAFSNQVVVTGPSSVWTNTGSLTVAFRGRDNQLIVTNGGTVYSTSGIVGSDTSGNSNNTVLVSDPGSQWILTTSTGLTVGNSALGNNKVTIANGGLLEANSLVTGAAAGNIITNVGGIYQFTTNTPTITPNGTARISITDGTISFRGITNANVYGNVSGTQLANMLFSGKNTFRLNDAANASGVSSYTFDSGHGPTNYVALELINGSTIWRSSSLTIGGSGSLLISNTTATIAGALVSTGTVHVVNSHATYSNIVTIAGRYISDPSTNTFVSNVLVGPNGTLEGGAGDLFDFKQSLLISDTSSSLFDLDSSTVSFSGGGIHTNAITGADYGNNGVLGFPDGFRPENFAYGRLLLGSTNDQVQFTSGSGAASNALYITFLDLASFTNDFSSVSNMVTSLLFAPANINIYYGFASPAPGNAYLMNQVYQLGDGLGGIGGLLMPAIPEPSSLMLLVLTVGGWFARKRRAG